MKRIGFVGTLLGLVACSVVVVSRPRVGAEDGSTSEQRVLFTSDSRGFLEPCGCEAGQFGGVARRATALAKLRGPQDVLLDLGNLGGGPGDLHRLGWAAMLDALREMKYDALVPAGTDLAEIDSLSKAVTSGGTPVICANLVRTSDGSAVFPRWMIRTVAGGKRLAVIGVTSAAQKVAGSYLLLPVPAAVRDAVAELGGKADCVIVAGWIEGQPALDLAREFPEISLVLAGHVPRGSDELLRRDGAPVAVGGERAQYVVVVGMNAACAPVGARRVWLGEDTAEDPALYARVRAWKEDLRRRGDDAVAASLSEFKNAGRVGSQACAECHDAEHRIWRATKHARAMDSLRAKQEDRNALCLSCHLQDIRVQDGSAVVDRDGGVGCEGCHGPGARHIGAKRRKEPTTPMNAIGKVGAASCLRCHDEENSRNFEFGRFWSAVKHPEATPEKR